MIRPIMRDIVFLSKKSAPASKADLPVCRDLIDTLKAHENECVGMAANMIGVSKRIIIVHTPLAPIVMLNPTVKAHSKESYAADEGCLSLEGTRKTKRWESITVEYDNMSLERKTATYSGFTAQIIQHEIDHLNGIII